MNKIEIVGNFTSAPTQDTTQSGKAIAKVTIASDRGKNDESGTDFIRLTAWESKAADLMKFASGEFVRVNGSLRIEPYQKDGVTHYGATVNVRSIERVEKKQAA